MVNSKYVLLMLLFIGHLNLSAQVVSIEDSLILMNNRSYELLKDLIFDGSKAEIQSTCKKMSKYLWDTTPQKAILFVEKGPKKERDTHRVGFKITKQIACIYIISALHYRKAHIGDYFNLNDKRNNIIIKASNQEYFASVAYNIQKWINDKGARFPLSKKNFFWQRRSKSNKRILKMGNIPLD